MNIYKINSDYKTKVPSSDTRRQEDGFKRIFAQKMSEINAANPQASPHCTGDIVEKAEGLLSLLEEYARGLSDPNISLRDIGPLVERIREEVSFIEAEACEKGSSDSGLARLIRELSVTANVAVFKFHRGDYM
jgi:hypothetical protein